MSELIAVESYVIDSVKETQIEYDIPNCPISEKARRLIMAYCPVVIVDPESANGGLSFTDTETSHYEELDLGLKQPSSFHKRSFMVTGSDFEQLWFDEEGNLYNSFSIKGNNFSNPGLMEHPTAIDQYVAWGLQESKIIERVLIASKVMRERGISTEYIVGLAEPKSYPWPLTTQDLETHENVNLAEYRRRVTKQYWSELSTENQSSDELNNLREKMDAMTFYFSLRATDCAYRLGDIEHDKDARKTVYDHINDHWLLVDHKPLDVELPKDWNRYLTEYLSPRIADNLSKLHIDLAHGFMHKYNVTGLGGIVDTDSIHGEGLGLGDAPITSSDRAKDLFQIASELQIAQGGNYLSFKRSPIVNSFIRDYIMLSIQTGDVTEAFGRVGKTIFESQKLSMRDSYKLSEDMLKAEMTNAYFSTFKYTIADQDAYKAHDSYISNEIEDASIDCDAEIFGQLDIRLPIYAEALIEEAADDMVNNNFDAAEHLLLNKGGYDASHSLEIEVQDLVIQFLKQTWLESYDKHFPEYVDTFDYEVIELLFKSHMAEKYKDICRQAKLLLSGYYDRNKDELTKLSDFKTATPILETYEHIYNAGCEKGFLWISTNDVPISNVVEYAKQNTIEIKTKRLKATNLSWISLSIKKSNTVQQVLTDGTVAMTSYNLDSNILKIDVESSEAVELTEPTYVAVLKKDSRGNETITLHVIDNDISDNKSI